MENLSYTEAYNRAREILKKQKNLSAFCIKIGISESIASRIKNNENLTTTYTGVITKILKSTYDHVQVEKILFQVE